MAKTVSWRIEPTTRYKVVRTEEGTGMQGGHEEFGEYWTEEAAQRAMEVFRDTESSTGLLPEPEEPAGYLGPA